MLRYVGGCPVPTQQVLVSDVQRHQVTSDANQMLLSREMPISLPIISLSTADYCH